MLRQNAPSPMLAHADRGLISVFVALILVGLVMVYSANLPLPSQNADSVFWRSMRGHPIHLAIGLVDRVTAPESVYDDAVAWARQLARGPRLAMQAAKSAISRGMETDLEDGLEIERVHFASLFGTRDREVGMSSFIENGPGKAEFTGS